jgi:endonuclease G
MSSKKKNKKSAEKKSRRFALKIACLAVTFVVAWAYMGSWFVHHSRSWIEKTTSSWPSFVTAPLIWIGNPVSDITDAMGITGHDAVYEYDTEAPTGAVTFAGTPKRISSPAPDDIEIIDRGEFKIGWSPKLRHPVWVAYHVPEEAKFNIPDRPNFAKDKTAPKSPPATSYGRSGYDRGHMAPNHAISSRFGAKLQKLTFLMSNITPQTPALNRGVWRETEHRIADLWTKKWGEIWVIVGCISEAGGETIGGTDIDVPRKFYQLIVAQKGLDVRAMALLFEQEVPWRAWPTRYLVTVDELEQASGLDFLSELPSFIQDPLESELPSRLWPINFFDIIKQLSIHFS